MKPYHCQNLRAQYLCLHECKCDLCAKCHIWAQIRSSHLRTQDHTRVSANKIHVWPNEIQAHRTLLRIKKYCKMANYFGILQRLGSTTVKKKYYLWANRWNSRRRAFTVVVQILHVVKAWFSPIKVKYFSCGPRCSARESESGPVCLDPLCTRLSRDILWYGFIVFTFISPSTLTLHFLSHIDHDSRCI